MPSKTKSRFADKLAGAHSEHRSDETKVGAGGGLPAGIEGGVARLSDLKVGVYAKGKNAGEPFFMAAGVVLSPDTVVTVDPGTKKKRTIPVRGHRTQIGPIPICETESASGKVTTIDENWARILNHLRLLGLQTKELEVGDIVAEPKEGTFELGVAASALLETKPTFSFRTWKGKPTPDYPDPRVNEEWRGACEYTDEEGDEVDDGTGGDTAWEGEEETPAETPEPEVEEAAVPEPEEDWAALAKLADAGKPKVKSENAARTLAEKAETLGVDYEAAENWASVAELILSGAEESEGEEEVAGDYQEEEELLEEEEDDEPEAWQPIAGEQAFIDHPKEGKLQCTIVEVDEEAKTASIKFKKKGAKRFTAMKKAPFSRLSAE